jgi:subtilisin family serine protease
MKKSVVVFASIFIFSSVSIAKEVPPSNVFNDDLANVQNRCIVSMSDDVAFHDVPGLARSFAARANSSLKYIYRHSIKGFTINMPCHAAEAAFGADSLIVAMEPDSIVSINKGKPTNPGNGGGGGEETSRPPQIVPYGTTRVGGPENGSGYTAWIIDTGIDLDHPDLNVDVSDGFTAINKGGMEDQNGHGTHVAGTIAAKDDGFDSLGVAAGATVVPVRVLDRRGSGSISGVIAGVDWVGDKAAIGDCVNMSLGGGVSQTLDDAVLAASNDSGAFFALAAGNSGDDANNHSPARANGDFVWTISAVDINDNMPSWSNYGSPVDYAAPGVSIFSLWKNGGTNTISGTSMAAPHACAVLMLRGGEPGNDGAANNDPDGNPDPIIHLQF